MWYYYCLIGLLYNIIRIPTLLLSEFHKIWDSKFHKPPTLFNYKPIPTNAPDALQHPKYRNTIINEFTKSILFSLIVVFTSKIISTPYMVIIYIIYENIFQIYYTNLVTKNLPWYKSPEQVKIPKEISYLIKQRQKTLLNGNGVLCPTKTHPITQKNSPFTEAFDSPIFMKQDGELYILSVTRNPGDETFDNRDRFCLAGGGIFDKEDENIHSAIKKMIPSNINGAVRELQEEAIKSKAVAQKILESSSLVGVFWNTNDPRACSLICPITTIRVSYLGEYDIKDHLGVTDIEEVKSVQVMSVKDFILEAKPGNVFAGHEVIVMECIRHLYNITKITQETFIEYTTFYDSQFN